MYMYMYCSYFIIQVLQSGWSLLHQAADCNKVSIVDLIIKHGCDVNIKNLVSDYILFVIHM